MSRAKLLITALAVVLNLLVIGQNPKKAAAWTDDLPTCSALIPGWELPTNWQDLWDEIAAEDADWTGSYIVYTTLYAYNDTYTGGAQKKISYVIHSGSPTGYAKITEDSSGNRLIIGEGTIRRSTIQDDDINPDTYYTYNPGSGVNADCIQEAQNLKYSENYSGNLYDHTAAPNPADNNCDKWDIPCWISGAFDDTVDTLSSIGPAIVNGIARLFIPRTDLLSTYFSDFQSFLAGKLGALTYPFEFFIDFFMAIRGECDFCENLLDTPPYQEPGQLLGTDLLIGFQANWLWNDNNVWVTKFRPIVQVVTMTALIYGLIHKYRKIVYDL